MAKREQFRRLFWFALLLSLAFAGLGYRLVDLQVIRHEELSAKAQKNSARKMLLEPRRGDILDTRGSLLATVTYVKTVCADPSLLGNHQAEVAKVLSPLLQESEERLIKKLQPTLRLNAAGETVTNQFVVLKRKVPMETWAQVTAAMAGLQFKKEQDALTKAEARFFDTLRKQAVFGRDEQMRVYPNKKLAAHVLGHATVQEREVEDMLLMEIAGRDGIEYTLNSKLAGVPGWRVTETGRDRRELVPKREQNVAPRDGLNVVLTIDSVVQHILETSLEAAVEKHSPISISGLVVRPKTGEILGMATLPNYDPNEPGDFTRNRIITDQVEPGSTFKIVVVSAALNEGIVRLTDMFDCERGRFYFGGRTLHDHDPYEVISVERIITKSSNIGAAKIGIKLGQDRLYEYVRRFGFGTRTDIPLIGEVAGIVHPVKRWSKVSIAQLPMGHGLTVTPLQMTMAMCAIANKGSLMRPMLVQRLEDREGGIVAQYYPQRTKQVVSEPAARMMVEALKTVVSPEGTAAKAMLDHYTVAGKTGTAQKVENGVYVRKYIASFIGFFPADDPELCVSIMMDEPKKSSGYYGGQTAAPVFRQVAERVASYLSIKPDIVPMEPDAPVVRGGENGLKTAALRN